MARLSAAARKALPIQDFAVPSKAPGPGSYPMPDPAHAAVAKGRAATNAPPAVQKMVAAKAATVMAPARMVGRPATATVDKAKHHAAVMAAFNHHIGG